MQKSVTFLFTMTDTLKPQWVLMDGPSLQTHSALLKLNGSLSKYEAMDLGKGQAEPRSLLDLTFTFLVQE